MTRRLVATVLVVFTIALGVFAPTAGAETYPTKPVTFVVPFPAGGRTDLAARLITQILERHLGAPTVVVNKAGAGGVLGAKEVSRARADGYTLGFFSTGVLTAQYTVPTPTDLKDYDLVAIVNVDPAAIAVSEQAPWKTIRELVDYARANPGKLRIGAQLGASAQVFAAAFVHAAGIKVTYVPFKGDADAAIAVAGGHIDMHVGVPVAYKSLVEAGKLRILGVAADRRSPLYKNIPTWKEQGIDVVITSFHGVFAPHGTPSDVLKTLETAIQKTMAERDLQDKMEAAGLGVVYLGGKDAAAYVAQQDVTYRTLIRELGMMMAPKK
ncbi:MAG: tripartite tricarboxylate transporter substrate binding protein [Terriglobia bacterium]